jgi:hypothetical protein
VLFTVLTLSQRNYIVAVKSRQIDIIGNNKKFIFSLRFLKVLNFEKKQTKKLEKYFVDLCIISK